MTKPIAKTRTPKKIFAMYLVVVAGFAAAMVPFVVSYRRVQGQIVHYQLRRQNAAYIKQRLANYQHEIQSLRKRTHGSHELVPVHMLLGDFLHQLNQCKRAAGFRDATVQSGNVSLLAMCRVLPISVEGSGTAGEFAQFMRKLEALPRKCWVKRLSMKAEEKMRGRIHAHFTVEIYALGASAR